MQKTKKGKAALAIPVLAFIYISVSLYYRESPSDAIDVHSSLVIKDYLDKSDFCKALAGENSLSYKDVEVLRSIKEHEVSIYADLRQIEQEINCLSLPMANILYGGWAVKRYEQKDSLIVNIEGIASQIINAGLFLTVDQYSYIPYESVIRMDEVDFFKKPFTSVNSLLDEIYRDGELNDK